jgi:hypothetical protein
MKHCFIVVSVVLFSTSLSAQDLGNLKDAKPFGFSGNVSLRLNSYSTTREQSVRDPFFWTITGTPTVSIYGVTLPFYFSFSQKNQDYRQPFNQFGLSPYYKWLKLHLGYRNISFSDFTLSNHTFLGAGVEAEPGIFRFGFVYGRFLKAVNQPIDTLSGDIITPVFARKGVAAKIGVGTYNNFVDLIFFKGKDDSTSVDAPLYLSATRPAENLVYGIKARQVFLKIFSFDLDYGFSIYTNDISAPEIDPEEYNIPSIVTAFIKPRTSTTFLMAGKASLGVRLKMLSLRLQYTRVEPDYQSMGSYFLNNDYENYTIAPSWSMFKSKLRVNASVGIQRNNLFNDKLASTNRQINSINISFMPNPKYNVSAFYTNYRINQERNLRLTLDTLKLEQFSGNLNLNGLINLGTKQRRHMINGGFNYQALKDDSNVSETNNNTTSVNPMLGYRFQNTVNKFGVTFSVNLNKFTTDVNSTDRWGYSLGGNKSFFDDQLSLNLSATYFTIAVDGTAQSTALSFNGRGSLRIKEKHSLDLGVGLVNRNQVNSDEGSVRDILANFGYSFNFGKN